MKQLTPQALTVLEKRYLRKDEKGQVIETPDEMFLRVASALGKDADQALDFYHLMADLDFLPNSPTLMNAGTGAGSLSACFVIPVEDSMEGITKASHDAAMVQKFGGGTGFSLSRIRPKGAGISTTHGAACGPVAVLKYLSATSTLVTQGGKRDGANMGILRVDHPDIREFIHCKDASVAGNAGDTLHNFNISVGITDEFEVRTVSENGEFRLIWNGLETETVNARELWQEIVESAHKTGDPGVVFLDRINNGPANPVPSLGPIEATNPCGEQPLYPYDSCNLGSLNLGNFVRDDGTFDFERLKKATQVAVLLLDRVVTVNTFPLQEVADLNEKIRRIGLGVMGWHDALIKMRIPYASEEAVKLGKQVMEAITNEGSYESMRLGQELGSFPLFSESIYSDAIALRNSTITTIAPTGTISLIAGASSGIEPVFAWEYKHNGLEGRIKETVKHPLYQQALDEGWYTPELFQSAMEIAPEWHLRHQAAFQAHTDNAVSKTINLPQSATVEDVKRCYEMAWDLGCKGVTIYRDGSKGSQVLETVKPAVAVPEPGMTYNRNFKGHNFTKDLSKCSVCGDTFPFINSDDARWCPGVKPVVIEPSLMSPEFMGDVSAPRIIGSDGADYTDAQLGQDVTNLFKARPAVLNAVSIKQPTPFGTAYLTITEDEGQPLELFATLGKAGSDVAGMLEAMCRVVSKQLRAANPGERRGILSSVRDQWAGIGGATTSGFGPSKVKSLPDALSRALGRYLDNEAPVEAVAALQRIQVNIPILPKFPEAFGTGDMLKDQEWKSVTVSLDLCPDCQNYTLHHAEGCAKCLDCGYSKC
jgi:ribonucleoside-diphosphate reductase alpha chain